MRTARSNRIVSYLLTCFIAAGSYVSANAQVAAGGIYSLDQAVVANGGGTSTGPNYKIDGTSGQNAAGGNLAGGIYILKGGFWSGAALAPSAAGVTVSGRVLTVDGSGLKNVLVTLAGGALTSPRTVMTGTFGYFSFPDVEAGRSYVVTVKSRKYGFPQPAQAFSVNDSITDLVFQAGWQN